MLAFVAFVAFVAFDVFALLGLAQRVAGTASPGSGSCPDGREGGSPDTTPGALYCRGATTNLQLGLLLATPTRDSEPIATESVDDIHLCPLLSGEPGTFLSAASNLTFGCSPGFMCDPPKPGGCNLWPRPPPDTYKCPSGYCIEAPVVDYIVSPTGEIKVNRLSDGYFNLDPRDFGLSFAIFADQPTQLPRPSLHRRETLPSICFDDCNAAHLIALSTGKTASLCKAGSAFQSAYRGCIDCARDNRVDSLRTNTTAQYEPPAFTQFLHFCNQAAITTTTILDVSILPANLEPSLLLVVTPSGFGNETVPGGTLSPDPIPTSAGVSHDVSILCFVFCAFAAYW